MGSAYTDEDVLEAENHPSLGAEYFAARRTAESVIAAWPDGTAEALAEAVVKPLVDQVYREALDAFRDYLLMDAELNLQSRMRDMVESSVRALIGGDEWANVKYIKPEAYRSEKVRETLAKLHSDEIKDGRIADLEREVEQLKERARFREGA